MTCLKFDQGKHFSENNERIRGWSWLVYKIVENNCFSRLSVKLIQTPKMVSSFDNIRLLVTSSQNISCEQIY